MQDGFSALIRAAIGGKSQIVELLLAEKADVNAQNKVTMVEGYTRVSMVSAWISDYRFVNG